jgi:hypothetical protein
MFLTGRDGVEYKILAMTCIKNDLIVKNTETGVQSLVPGNWFPGISTEDIYDMMYKKDKKDG